MTIILNEREYAQEAIENNTLYNEPIKTLNKVAKYYHAQGYKKMEIHHMLEDFMLKCDSNTNIVKWQKAIEWSVKTAAKYPLVELEYIPLTQKELDTCAALDKVRLRRLLFTLICLAKYGNAISPNNHNWVNQQDKEIFKLANITVGVKQQSFLLHDLRELGHISFNRRVDNININVTCVDDVGAMVLPIFDFRNLGYQYLKYCGEPYFECSSCGLVVKRNNNRQKYCPECAQEINRKKNREHWQQRNSH